MIVTDVNKLRSLIEDFEIPEYMKVDKYLRSLIDEDSCFEYDMKLKCMARDIKPTTSFDTIVFWAETIKEDMSVKRQLRLEHYESERRYIL